MHSRQGDIADLNTENGVSNISKCFVSGIEYHVLVAPTAKEANLLELGDLLGQGREGSDLNFPVVGHFGRVSWEVVVGWMSRQVEASVNKGNWVRSLSPVWGSHEIRAGRAHQSTLTGHVICTLHLRQKPPLICSVCLMNIKCFVTTRLRTI